LRPARIGRIVETMKYLSYLGETVLTTDGVGDAVIEYARALVADKSADVVDIPVVVDDEEMTASLLIGPSSPLMVVEAIDHEKALKDDQVIARMHALTVALGPHRARPSESFIADLGALTYDFL
jgi:hypothetical protein